MNINDLNENLDYSPLERNKRLLSLIDKHFSEERAIQMANSIHDSMAHLNTMATFLQEHISTKNYSRAKGVMSDQYIELDRVKSRLMSFHSEIQDLGWLIPVKEAIIQDPNINTPVN